jgi:hypothetical protein
MGRFLMPRSRTKHTINGKFIGMYYETEAGTKVYLGHRQLRHLNRKFNGWSIDLGTLNKCKQLGFNHVGIVCRRSGKKHVWLTRVEDFFHPEKSFVTRSKIGIERGIRLTHFMVDPANDPNIIDAAFRIG